MTIHPPLLYVGLAAAFGAGRSSPSARRPAVARRLAARHRRRAHGGDDARRGLELPRAGLGRVLGVGPGGEHVAAGVARRAASPCTACPSPRPAAARRWRALPWVLAVVGAVLVRSGTTPSIHGFAEQRAVGWPWPGSARRRPLRPSPSSPASPAQAPRERRADPSRPAPASPSCCWPRPVSSSSPARCCRCSPT